MYLDTVSPAILLSSYKQLCSNGGNTLVMLLAENDPADPADLIAALNAHNVPFIGAVFPKLIFNDALYTHGMICFVVDAPVAPLLIEGLDSPDFTLPDLTLYLTEAASGCDLKQTTPGKCTTLLFVDALCGHIDLLLHRIYDELGSQVNYIGGGAGSIQLRPIPCILAAQGVLRNVAVLLLCKNASSLSAKHGWQQAYGPVVATEVENNTIKQLNWDNAITVYQQAITASGGGELDASNFMAGTRAFPFGISKEEEEVIVRDPIATADNAHIICVGAIPQNASLYILKGDEHSLIAAAQRAAEESLAGFPANRMPTQSLIIDCISRQLFLAEAFSREMSVVQSVLKDLPLEGALTLGEISSFGDGYLEFFNKTIVVGLLQ